MENSLFRHEALTGGRENWLGNVLLHEPWSHSVIAIIAISFVAMIAAFSYLGTYTRKATVTGLLIPEQGLLRLAASEKGVVAEVNVNEGQSVATGDVLFVVSDERLSNAGSFQRQVSKQLEQRIHLLNRSRALATERADIQVRTLDGRIKSIDEELDRFNDELRLSQKRIQLAEAHMERQRELVAAKFITIVQLQNAEAELLALKGQHQALIRSHKSTQRDRMELLSERTGVDLRRKSDLSEIDNGIAVVKQEQAENDLRAGQISVAPFDGKITGVSIQPGQQLMPGTLLASLIPHDAKLVAHVYVASSQIGFVEAGQLALMRYAAYPYQKFGTAKATVLDVAKSPYALQELPVHIAETLSSTARASELFYRVTLALESQTFEVYGEPQSLRVGMLVEADIIQERRRLFEWIFEPIYAIGARIFH